MKKVIKLTESELKTLIERVVTEDYNPFDDPRALALIDFLVKYEHHPEVGLVDIIPYKLRNIWTGEPEPYIYITTNTDDIFFVGTEDETEDAKYSSSYIIRPIERIRDYNIAHIAGRGVY